MWERLGTYSRSPARSCKLFSPSVMYQQRNARNNADTAHEGQLTVRNETKCDLGCCGLCKAMLLVPDGLVKMFQKELFSWDIKTQQSEKNNNNPINVCSAGGKTLLIRFQKATVTLIFTLYNGGKQKSVSECTAYQALRWVGYNSGRPHQPPLSSAKTGTTAHSRHGFAQAGQSRLLYL